MIRIGTSGFAYPEWKGLFYPAGLPASRRLGFYASRFPTVEINYTFARLPTGPVIERWLASTSPEFIFALKAPRRITHLARLKHCEDAVGEFCAATSGLGRQRGPVLFQLPPNFKKDVVCLQAFLDGLPRNLAAAFEFRHESWHDDEVFDRLRSHRVALCVVEGERLSTPVIHTADIAYFRLRGSRYSRAALTRWTETIARAARECRDVFVYVKHDDEAKGPAFAARLRKALVTASANSTIAASAQ